MKNLKPFVAVAAALASIHTLSAADITGKVTLKGTPPKGPEYDISTDAACGSPPAAAKRNAPWYIVDKDGGLAEAFVYLKSVPGTFTAPTTAAVLDQVNCEYTPYIVGVQTRQTIQIKNSDKGLHNVHVTPTTGSSNPESNKAQMAGQPALTYSFTAQEIFLRFKCDVHAWMNAYVSVLPHPFFAVTKADGTFTIKNVPAGTYTIEAVHRKTQPTGTGGPSKSVTVGAANVTADFTIDAPAATP